MRRIRRLERSHEEIQVEETLVFDFLHGLGEAFRETIRPQELHRLIVEGATRILDAHGGALYMTDRTGRETCAGVYLQRLSAAGRRSAAYFATSRGHSRRARELSTAAHDCPGEGLIGRVWQTGQSVCLTEFSEAPELAKLRGSAFGSSSVMAASLRYGNQDLGVLALANGPTGAPFSQGDFVVFKSIAEQSAFALYNAIIYSDGERKETARSRSRDRARHPAHLASIGSAGD